MSEPAHDLQVIIASGANELERASVGLAFALAAAVSGDRVVVFLTALGAAWTDPDAGAPKTPGFQSIGEYLALLLEADARIEGCTSCVEHYSLARRGPDGHRAMIAGLEFAGLGVAAIRSSSTRTITF